MSEYKYKTYRCEFLTEIYEVDPYGYRGPNSTLLYEAIFPTVEDAQAHLHSITVESSSVNRYRDWPQAPHSYYNLGVRYREVAVINE